ncbi:hypothetical protein DJ71_00740 [Halorubrum sp. E3]|nr:hypothetical protein DJ71_00740 [Halorubrum sp. E3]
MAATSGPLASLARSRSSVIRSSLSPRFALAASGRSRATTALRFASRLIVSARALVSAMRAANAP